MLHPDDRDTVAPRLVDEPADVRDDRVARMRVLDDTVLHVDNQECGIRPVLESAHDPSPQPGSEVQSSKTTLM